MAQLLHFLVHPLPQFTNLRSGKAVGVELRHAKAESIGIGKGDALDDTLRGNGQAIDGKPLLGLPDPRTARRATVEDEGRWSGLLALARAESAGFAGGLPG